MTYGTRFEGDPNVDLSGTASKFKPSVLRGHVVEVRSEPCAAHENIIAHVICDSVPPRALVLQCEGSIV